MEVVSRVTDGYCDRVQVLMEITTGGPTVAQVIEDTSISQLNFGISQVAQKLNSNVTGVNGRHPRGQVDLYCNQVICDTITSPKQANKGF